jgi:LysR family transcriptional regulator (chromosome initiation inhibitor)
MYCDRTRRMLSVALDDEGHTAEWLQRGRVLAAVTALGKPVQGCHMTALGKLRYHATASPEYVDQYFSAGVTAETIAKAPALTSNQKDQLQSVWIEQVLGQSVLSPTHWLPSTQGSSMPARRAWDGAGTPRNLSRGIWLGSPG